MKRVEISREQLYRAVWSKSLSKAAEEIDITFEQLVLACAGFDIPRPPSGYWTKRLHKTQLPPQPQLEGDPARIVDLGPSVKAYKEESEQHAKELEKFKSFSSAKVSSRLVDPHPAVKSIVAERRDGFQFAGGSGFIRSLHSSPIDDVTKRIFRILDCLANILTREGFIVEPGGMGALWITWRSVTTSIRFKERMCMPRDSAGKVVRTGDLLRTGILISERPYTFEDRADAPIETQIPRILRSIAAACLDQERRALEAAERARQVEARRAELLAERAFAQKKKDALEKLLLMSESWHQAKRAREFLAVIETLPESSTVFLGLTSSQWINLLRAKIIEADPLQDGLEGLLKRVTD
jgi:hypothetical protein